MNKVHLMGRLTRDPDIRYTQGDKPMAIARFTLAVNRQYKKDGEQTADFISCVAFGKQAEHAEKYYYKGIKIVISGRIQTGSYTNSDGQKVYTTEVIVENQEFAESKAVKDRDATGEQTYTQSGHEEGFVPIPDELEGEVPFDLG